MKWSENEEAKKWRVEEVKKWSEASIEEVKYRRSQEWRSQEPRSQVKNRRTSRIQVLKNFKNERTSRMKESKNPSTSRTSSMKESKYPRTTLSYYQSSNTSYSLKTSYSI